MTDRYHFGPTVVTEHTVEGFVLLPGWQHDPLNRAKRIPTAWPAVRPPQVGEQLALPGHWPTELDVRTVTAVRWLVPQWSGQRVAVGLAVEVGEREAVTAP